MRMYMLLYRKLVFHKYETYKTQRAGTKPISNTDSWNGIPYKACYHCNQIGHFYYYCLEDMKYGYNLLPHWTKCNGIEFHHKYSFPFFEN